jgi:hypothetical protein
MVIVQGMILLHILNWFVIHLVEAIHLEKILILVGLNLLVLFLLIVLIIGAAMIKLEPGIVRVKVLFFLLEENHGFATLLKDLSV